MQQYIILLRGINVGGIKILMKDLMLMLENIGFEKVKTYIQTGNVLLHSKEKDKEKISQQIAGAIKKYFAYNIEVFVSNKQELNKAIFQNPFQDRENINQDKVYCAIIKNQPTSDKWAIFQKLDFKEEEYHLIDNLIFWYSPYAFSDSKLNNNYFENKLKIVATTRNMKTIKKLVGLAD